MADRRPDGDARAPGADAARVQGFADRVAAMVQAPTVCMTLEAGGRLRTVARSPQSQQAPHVLELPDHPSVAESLRSGAPAFLDVDLSSVFGASQALLVPWTDGEGSSGVFIIVGVSPGTHPRRSVGTIATAITQRMGEMRELARLEHQVAELEQTSTAFRSLVESTSDAVKVTDLDGRVRVWNSACESLYGYTAREVIGQVLPFVPAAKRSRLIAEMRSAAALGVEQTSDVVSSRKDGSLFSGSVTAIPLTDADGLPVGVLSVVRKVDTDSRLDQMQTDFVALVTQELKNPLTAILGFTQLLSRPEIRDDPAKRARTARALEERAQRMSGLVDELLLGSRVDRGELVLRRARTDLAALVTETVSAFEHSAPRHRFVIDIDTRIPAAGIDGPRVAQALTHLLSNAVKHSPFTDEILVKVVRDGGFASVSVTDRGAGMSAEDLARAFDRFYKAHGSGRDPGIGLGLFLVRSIAEAHGGTVTAVSKPAKGSTFTMRLPLAVS